MLVPASRMEVRAFAIRADSIKLDLDLDAMKS
jgi:hypothetical protein